MNLAINRRVFLAASSSALSGFVVSRDHARADARQLPTGPVYARVGGVGIGPGLAGRPSVGEAELLDGRRLVVLHEGKHAIEEGKSVWLAPCPGGGFTILYAEV